MYCLNHKITGEMHCGESDAPLFGRPATVVRDGCDIADDGYLEPYGLHRANRRLPACPRAFTRTSTSLSLWLIAARLQASWATICAA
jgi:hypothetical protein